MSLTTLFHLLFSQVLARKEIDYRKMNEREKKQLVAEVNILRELRHPNIVKYYERRVDKRECRIYIVMEYCEGGKMCQFAKGFCEILKRISPLF